MEMVSVRLISFGTSAMVTAHSTYFSGGLIVLYIMLGIAVIADAIAIDSFQITVFDPITTDVATVRFVNVSAFAVGTDKELLIGRGVHSMPFKDNLCPFKQGAAFYTDQHSSSPSLTSMYNPQ